MKKFFQNLSFTLGTFLLGASSTLAQGGQGFFSTDPAPPPAVVSTDTLGGTITQIINYALGILGLVAVAFLIYAGILMVTAGGNDEQIGKAKGIIQWAVIGIVVIILSYTIVRFVTALGN